MIKHKMFFNATNKMFIWIGLLSIMASIIYAQNDSLSDLEIRLRDDPDLSQFYEFIEKDPVVMTALRYRQLTIFVPTNEAFQRYRDNIKQKTFVQYHIVTTPFPLQDLNGPIPTDYDGNQYIYISKQGKDIFVNQAEIIKSKSNQLFHTKRDQYKQYLHVIDDVLMPLTSNQPNAYRIPNLNALQFINTSNTLDIGTHRVRSFRERVFVAGRGNLFEANGYHTFLVPVEEGFKPNYRGDAIDGKVIDGHVIPKQVLFTTSVKKNEPFETAAFEDNLKVTASFFQEVEGKNTKTYVKSNTVIGDGTHSSGVVIAEIVQANIPVKNGVIHLIQRPLMVVDTTVGQFLEEDGPLHKFYEVILDHGDQFMAKINKLQQVTLFAPSNEAWNNPQLVNILADKIKMKEILDNHIVAGRLPIDQIKQKFLRKDFVVPTLAKRKNLFFNVLTGPDHNMTVTVEGGGVNATIIQGDVAATNGYVHIIDQVLGAPFKTVIQKLQQDPIMRTTYQLGSKSHFNERINGTQRHQYTYFVPSNAAWAQTELTLPTAYKKLSMNEYGYHTRNILERHLVLADRVFTMDALVVLANNSMAMPTARDALTIRVKQDSQGYHIIWDTQNILVVRPDVECTNGIIHVIDRPFLTASDITVPRNGSNKLNLNVIFILNLIIVYFFKFLV